MKYLKFFALFLVILLPFNLKAYVDNNNIIGYRYTDDFVINNKVNDFFGENGSLETIRYNLLSNRNMINGANFLIGFTKDDIIVIVDYNTNGEYYFYSQVSNGFDRILINASTRSGTTSTSTYRYYYKLSDYSSVSNFISGILTGSTNRYSITNINSYRLHISTGQDLRNHSFPWFSNNDNYFIPYFSTSTILNKCFGSLCTDSEQASIPFNIFGLTEYVPTYYNLFGYVLPNSSLTPKLDNLYKNAFTIDTAHINESWSLTYTFNYNRNSSNINHIDVYGLVNNNNIYYYEKINNNFNIYNYTWNCVNNTCNFNITNNDISYSNISSYEKIYFDIVYDNALFINRGSFSFNRTSPYILDVIVNDVCPDCLYLQLTTSGVNTYTFTSNSNTKDYEIYYSNIQANDIAYNSPSYVNFNTSELIDDVFTSYNNYYYGTFNRVLFDNYFIHNDYGLIMNIYQYNTKNIFDTSGAYQVIYFITPNIVWSNSQYNSDRTSVNTCYESEGITICTNVFGDFNNKYNSYNQIDNALANFKLSLGLEKIGITEILTTPFVMLKNSINNGVCNSLIIPIPFTDKTFSLPCMSDIYNNYVPDIIDLWHIVLWGIVIFGLGLSFIKTLLSVLDPDQSLVKGVDWLIR